MARITRARMNEEADYFEKVAAPRADAAAADGQRVANDPTTSDRTRASAATAARYAREHAADYREIAASLRDGVVPEGFQF